MLKSKSLKALWLFVVCIALTIASSSCYNSTDWRITLNDSTLTDAQKDSITFVGKKHYGINYNFIITADSLNFISQEPEECLQGLIVDSFSLYKDEPIVVADFRTLPNDSIDSLWVKIAGNEYYVGWIHESELHKGVVPDDPISQFIDIFSNIHLLIFCIVVFLVAGSYAIIRIIKKRAYIVHFNDIKSFYPTALALTVAISATLYASIQKFTPDDWQEFYYHPTLNPFVTPTLLCTFLVFVWIMFILAIATLDDVCRQLQSFEAFQYLIGLSAVCIFNYIFFSVMTLHLIGYVFLVAYLILAIYHHIRFRLKK
ncbi:MAG: zinc ribbon domain-containing protein [Prevotellaceae bacterium]|nr:zinc ribbon domain-containing protein [Prevotellaceae bacterium]